MVYATIRLELFTCNHIEGGFTMLPSYKTVQGYGHNEIVIDRSRFIAYINRAESEEEAIAFIDKIKKKHRDATHNCSAYLIGEHDQHQKANDDGEPSGTAGVPMLEVLKKKGLKDVVVVVTRYFGGVKLGAGGLIRAYTQATVAGLEVAQIIERKLHQTITFTIDYPLLGKIENEVRLNPQWIIDRVDYLETVTLAVLVPIDLTNSFTDFIVNLTSNQCYINFNNRKYVDHTINS